MTRLLQLHMQDAATDQELVTKTDLQLEMAPIKAELQVLKWMSGLIMGGIIALTRGSRARQFHFQ